MYDGSIKRPAASNQSLAPALSCSNTKEPVKFDGSCLKHEKVTFTHKKVNIYIVYETNLWLFTLGKNFAFGNTLFGAFWMTANADLNNCKCPGYGTRFNVRESFCCLKVMD